MVKARITKKGCKLKLTHEEAQFLRNLLGLAHAGTCVDVWAALSDLYDTTCTSTKPIDVEGAQGPVRLLR